jgi:signal transduction histidine kinase
MLEALRNTRRHALAEAAAIRASSEDGRVRILVDDNGVGFSKTAAAPWSIASRVAQFAGRSRSLTTIAAACILNRAADGREANRCPCDSSSPTTTRCFARA